MCLNVRDQTSAVRIIHEGNKATEKQSSLLGLLTDIRISTVSLAVVIRLHSRQRPIYSAAVRRLSSSLSLSLCFYLCVCLICAWRETASAINSNSTTAVFVVDATRKTAVVEFKLNPLYPSLALPLITPTTAVHRSTVCSGYVEMIARVYRDVYGLSFHTAGVRLHTGPAADRDSLSITLSFLTPHAHAALTAPQVH